RRPVQRCPPGDFLHRDSADILLRCQLGKRLHQQLPGSFDARVASVDSVFHFHSPTALLSTVCPFCCLSHNRLRLLVDPRMIGWIHCCTTDVGYPTPAVNRKDNSPMATALLEPSQKTRLGEETF